MLAVLMVFAFGVCGPFAPVLREWWRAKHSYTDGRQSVAFGGAWGLFGLWFKWLILIIITGGICAFWVGARIYRWRWQNTSWAQARPAPRAAALG